VIEYLILNDVHTEVQKKLNQWRHDYEVQVYVIGQSTSSAEKTYAVIGRYKKQEPIPLEYRA